MHEIRSVAPEKSREPNAESQVQVARAGHLTDLDALPRGRSGDRAATRTDQRAVHTAGRQTLEQIKYLLRAAVKMAARFDVHGLHRDRLSVIDLQPRRR